MRIGNWNDINWRRVWLLVLILYPLLFFTTCAIMSYRVS